MTKIKQVSTFAKIPAFVPFGVLYFTQDTSDLYIGTGSSTGAAVNFISGGGLLPSGNTTTATTAAASVATATNGNVITADGSGNAKDSGTLLSSLSPLSPALNTQVASYTAVLSDNIKIVAMNVASGNTFTVPLNATVAFPIGTTLTILQLGLGQVTLTPAASVTFVSAGSLLCRAQYSIVSLTKIATDTWVAAGDLA